ncbi:MAG: hypothetical protein DME59_13635 [Verrucomicrobia bacterium]|nr:MAG: hypothetical protein DME59_13635 [Verrucomicrobiota bacterium]
MNPLTQSKNTTILPVLIALTLAWFALSPQVCAVCENGCGDPGSGNTFLGEDALATTFPGANNTAIGRDVLSNNLNGVLNTGTGDGALSSNTAGYQNTAIGAAALLDNTTGAYNTATGTDALEANTTGSSNTASGAAALGYNTTGSNNTACGTTALTYNTGGNNNTAIGVNALFSNVMGHNNIALGASAGSSIVKGDNNIDIGNSALGDESNHIRIGTVGTQKHTFIAGISGSTIAGGVGVIIDSNGHLGTIVSSERFKDDVRPMDKASEAILALKPVTFRYKKELDPAGIAQFGLVAEEVEKVNPDLVARDDQGRPYSVRYEAVNAMLLNEFLKEHKAFLEEHRTVEELKQQVAALTEGLQKVTAQLETSKPVMETIANNQ